MTEDERAVWVFLVERGVDAGSDIRLFKYEADAIATARGHLADSLPADDLVTRCDVYEAIEAVNQLPENEEFIVLALFPVT